MVESKLFQILTAALGIWLPCAQALGGACFLEGKWDTGFRTTNGHTFVRVVHEFDCEGHSVLTAIQARGKMLQPMAEVIERRGTYTLGEPVPGEPGTFEVDVRIDTLTKRYLDPSTIQLGGDGGDCAPQDVEILVPFDNLGRNCDRATYPEAGYVERAVVRVDGDELYWSFFHGEKSLVVQKPEEPLRRHPDIDTSLVYKRISP